MQRLKVLALGTLMLSSAVVLSILNSDGSIAPAGEVVILNGNASGLARYGDWLYMVLNESTNPLLVYDIHEPTKPRLVRYLPAPGWPMRCRVIGDWLWTVHGNGEGFFHLADPSNPRFSAVPTEGPNLRRLERVWTREEWRPEFKGQKFLVHPCLTYSSCATESTLFYGNLEGTTEIYDIRDPKRPRLLATIDEGTPASLDGNLLFVAGSNKVVVYDVSEPSSPKRIGIVDGIQFSQLTANEFATRSSAVAYGDGKLFVVIRRNLRDFLSIAPGPFEGAQCGIAAFDVRDWSNPKLLGWYALPNLVSDFTSLVYHKGHIFVSDSAFGLRVFDVRDPQNIRQVASDRQGGELSAVALMSSRKVLCVGQNITGGLVFVDVSTPQKPRMLSYLHLAPCRFWGTMVTYRDRFLYAQGDFSRPRPGFSALFAVDLKDPTKPELTAIIPGVSRAYGMVVVDRYLYTSGGEIFDLSEPSKPHRLSARLPCSGYQIAFREPYLFVANFAGEGEGESQHGALYVVDISQRENPRLIGKLPLPLGHRVITMAFIGKHLFLGWAQRTGGRRPSGLLVAVDISDPQKPKVASQWEVDKDLGFNEAITYNHVWTNGKFLFLGIYHRWVAMFEVQERPQLSLRLIGKLGNLPSAWLMTGEPGTIYRICLDRIMVLHY